MAIDFPNFPSNGQTFVANEITYKYDSSVGAWLIDSYTSNDYVAPAFNVANIAYSHANAAFLAANNAVTDYSPAFIQANTARNHANAAFLAANNAVTDYSPAFNKANTANITADLAFNKANNAVLNNVTTLITVGYNVASYNASSNIAAFGTWQPNPSNGNYQWVTINGAVTIATPPSNCAIDILFVNAAARNPGAVTFSGYTVGSYTGTTYATTAGNRYILSIREINNIATYSWYALQ